MSRQISLKEAERKVFRATYDDGLWDIFLGSFLLIFVLGPYLSTAWGDFWSAAAFVPFWALVYLAIRLVRKHVVTPRVGVVRLGAPRRARLRNFTVYMLVINIVALILGIVAAVNVGRLPGQLIPIAFGLVLLVLFSFAAWFLDFTRLYLYALLLGISPLIGEWLWVRGYVAHHGMPVTFGAAIAVIVLVGVGRFLYLLHECTAPEGEVPFGKR